MKGLNNKFLEVDLNHDKFREVPIPEKILEDYIGGRGLGVKFLFFQQDHMVELLYQQMDVFR